MSDAINQYKTVNKHAVEEENNPYKIVQLLMQNVLDKVNQAKKCMKQDDINGKGSNISLAITTIDALLTSLDMKEGGAISENLDKLYKDMMQCLLEANINNDPELLDRVVDNMTKVKSGWDGIETEALEILENKKNEQ